MKIIILTDMIPNKKNPLASFFSINHAIQLHNRGHQVSIFFLNNYSLKTNSSIHLKRFIYKNIPSYSISFPVGRSLRLLTKLSSMIMIRILYSYFLRFSEKPQIIHAHFLEMGQALMGLKNKFDGKTVLTEHSYQFGINRRYSNNFIKNVYVNIDKLTVVSSFLQKEIYNKLNIDSVLIPNYFNEKLFKFSTRKINNTFRIISVINLVPIKNIELLISSFLLFSKKIKSILYIIGDGPLKSKINFYIKSNSINNIKLLGYKKQIVISKYLKKAHVAMITSKVETFNIFLIEAMSTGIPVVSTDCGGPSDYIFKHNGVISKINDPMEIANALNLIYSKYDSYDKKLISNEIKKKYSSKSIFDLWERFYLEIL